MASMVSASPLHRSASSSTSIPHAMLPAGPSNVSMGHGPAVVNGNYSPIAVRPMASRPAIINGTDGVRAMRPGPVIHNQTHAVLPMGPGPVLRTGKDPKVIRPMQPGPVLRDGTEHPSLVVGNGTDHHVIRPMQPGPVIRNGTGHIPLVEYLQIQDRVPGQSHNSFPRPSRDQVASSAEQHAALKTEHLASSRSSFPERTLPVHPRDLHNVVDRSVRDHNHIDVPKEYIVISVTVPVVSTPAVSTPLSTSSGGGWSNGNWFNVGTGPKARRGFEDDEDTEKFPGMDLTPSEESEAEDDEESDGEDIYDYKGPFDALELDPQSAEAYNDELSEEMQWKHRQHSKPHASRCFYRCRKKCFLKGYGYNGYGERCTDMCEYEVCLLGDSYRASPFLRPWYPPDPEATGKWNRFTTKPRPTETVELARRGNRDGTKNNYNQHLKELHDPQRIKFRTCLHNCGESCRAQPDVREQTKCYLHCTEQSGCGGYYANPVWPPLEPPFQPTIAIDDLDTPAAVTESYGDSRPEPAVPWPPQPYASYTYTRQNDKEVIHVTEPLLVGSVQYSPRGLETPASVAVDFTSITIKHTTYASPTNITPMPVIVAAAPTGLGNPVDMPHADSQNDLERAGLAEVNAAPNTQMEPPSCALVCPSVCMLHDDVCLHRCFLEECHQTTWLALLDPTAADTRPAIPTPWTALLYGWWQLHCYMGGGSEEDIEKCLAGCSGGHGLVDGHNFEPAAKGLDGATPTSVGLDKRWLKACWYDCDRECGNPPPELDPHRKEHPVKATESTLPGPAHPTTTKFAHEPFNKHQPSPTNLMITKGAQLGSNELDPAATAHPTKPTDSTLPSPAHPTTTKGAQLGTNQHELQPKKSFKKREIDTEDSPDAPNLETMWRNIENYRDIEDYKVACWQHCANTCGRNDFCSVDCHFALCNSNNPGHQESEDGWKRAVVPAEAEEADVPDIFEETRKKAECRKFCEDSCDPGDARCHKTCTILTCGNLLDGEEGPKYGNKILPDGKTVQYDFTGAFDGSATNVNCASHCSFNHCGAHWLDKADLKCFRHCVHICKGYYRDLKRAIDFDQSQPGSDAQPDDPTYKAAYEKAMSDYAFDLSLKEKFKFEAETVDTANEIDMERGPGPSIVEDANHGTWKLGLLEQDADS
ncbi:hypothetical protein K490DRAFT_60082 [Saccharata proteae CBS 121410]|uniref:Uncharacterized protein n=1 Tax=Saccharata proteae CBS 121410 TaxID=1314787 RepID=A0A9P4HQS0_9PEZI|nr:hypothetical protein K490DRAFT_60082 [Saccharata proteae CBS 121410]